MKCKFENDYIIFADYITGQLNESDRSELEAHLFECEQCRLKADVVEKVGHVIHVEGHQTIDAPVKVTFSDKVKVFFDSLAMIKYPKLAMIPLLGILLFAAGSLPFYYATVDSVYDLKVDKKALSSMRSFDDGSKLSMQEKTFNLQLSEGLNAFVKDEYNEALTIFNSLAALLQDSTVADSIKNIQVFQYEYCLGVTKAASWQNNPFGYFEWVLSNAQGRQHDKSRLTDAHAHLVKALELSREISKIRLYQRADRPEQNQGKSQNILLDEEKLHALLTSIESKINS
jgi:hypothetical protein